MMLVLGLASFLLRWRAAPHQPGDLGFAFLVAYPILRAGVDLVRINLSGWPSPDQVASLAVSSLAALAWCWARASGRREGPAVDRSASSVSNRERELTLSSVQDADRP